MNKLSFLPNIFIYISSYIPLFFLLIIFNINLDALLKLLFEFNISHLNLSNIINQKIFVFILCIAIIVTIISLNIIISRFKNINETEYIIVKEKETTDTAIINYLFTYLIPFIFANKIEMLFVLLFVFLICFKYYSRSNLISINPYLMLIRRFSIIKIRYCFDGGGETIYDGFIMTSLDEYEIKRNVKLEIKNVHQKFFYVTSIIDMEEECVK